MTVWRRPHALGYPETLRGLGGIVSPLLAGFSLAAIATIVTGEEAPPLADWAVAAFAAAVALLLFGMQVAFDSLRQNSSPQDVLAWRPEATVCTEELQLARAAQAADLEEMARLSHRSLQAYEAGLIAFLLAVLLLLIPDDWSLGRILGVTVTALALLLEVWWVAANRRQWRWHPLGPPIESSHEAKWDGDEPPPLDPVGLAAVIDPDRREAAGLSRELGS